MIENEIKYSSFLLRIWQINKRSRPTQAPEWVCELESVQSRETWKVKSLEALFVLLEEQSGSSQD